jgi:hypothetical protein
MMDEQIIIPPRLLALSNSGPQVEMLNLESGRVASIRFAYHIDLLRTRPRTSKVGGLFLGRLFPAWSGFGPAAQPNWASSRFIP